MKNIEIEPMIDSSCFYNDKYYFKFRHEFPVIKMEAVGSLKLLFLLL